MKSNHIYIVLAFVLLASCKENNSTDFKYQDKEDIITCEGLNNSLLKEAFYAFETDIYNYSNDSLQLDREVAYNKWIYPSSRNNGLDIKDVVSPYTVSLFERLKEEEPQLFDVTTTDSNLNYNSPLMRCIADSMNDGDLKVTFNALLKTNSMSPKLFGDRLIYNLLNVTRDPYMRYYVVFEYGYGRMFFNDFSEIPTNE